MSYGLLFSLAGSHDSDVMSNLIHVSYQENMVVLTRSASRLLPLISYCLPNQSNSVFLSQQTSRNSVFQPSFRPANEAHVVSYQIGKLLHLCTCF